MGQPRFQREFSLEEAGVLGESAWASEPSSLGPNLNLRKGNNELCYYRVTALPETAAVLELADPNASNPLSLSELG